MVYAPEKNKGPFPELPKVPLPAKKLNPEVEKYLTEEREYPFFIYLFFFSNFIVFL